MILKAVQMIKIIFYTQPDILTAEGRSQDRYRRAVWTSVASIVVRFVSIASNFIVVPLTIGYLGEEGFGIWMTLTSFMLFLSFTDLGLGVGLQNALAGCNGRDDKSSPTYYISSGLLALIIISIIFVAVAIFILPLFDLRSLVTIHNESTAAQLLPTAQAVLIAFGLGVPIGISQRIYNAYQKGYWGYLQLAAGNLLGLFGVLLCIHYQLELPILAFVFTWSRFSVPMLAILLLFWKNPWLRPVPCRVSLEHGYRILSTGVSAMGAQLAAMLIISGLPLVIANRFDVSVVTPLSLTQKIIGVTTTILLMVIWSLWPAYSEAAAQDDMAWVRKTFLRSVKLSIVVLIPTFIVISLVGRWIIQIWTGQISSVPSWPLLMAWNVWMLLNGWNIACRILLGGLGRMAGQATYGIAAGLIGLVTAWFISPYGLNYTIWAAVLLGEGLLSLLIGAEVLFTLRCTTKKSDTL